MPGLVPLRRRSEELSDEDEEVESGNVTPAPQVSSSSKRRRLASSALSDREDDVLPDNYRANPRNPNRTSTMSPSVHQPGSIVRIKMKNFVTYTSAEFKCGPSLNMIIGPNGTGKSTLVCAICLGLGFPPSCLGRAKDIGEYVKHGHREAEIEIEIAGGPRHKGRNPTIRCQIKRDGNKTQWYINGSTSTRKEVKQLVEKLHIQIDNLCQFLPQDRVVEFAQLSPIELLESTQKAAAPEQMSEWHNELKRLGKERLKLHQDQGTAKEHLDQLQGRQNQQRADVERMNERKALLEKVGLLEKGRTLVRYQTERKKYQEMESQRNHAKEYLRTLQTEMEPALRSVNAKESYHGQLTRVLKNRKTMVGRMEERTKQIEAKMEDLKTKIGGCDAELEAERKNDQKRRQDKKRHELNISKLRSRLNDQPVEFNAAEYNVRIREKEREIQELDNHKEELAEQRAPLMDKARERKKDLIDAQKNLENLRTESGQQLTKLNQLSKDTAKLWDWVQRYQNKFEGKVYGPPIIECSVKDRRYVDAVESLLQRGDLIACTVTSSADFKTLQEVAYGQMHLKDIVIRSVNRDLAHFQPPMSREALADFGFDAWAIDLLDGPEPVLTMLCDNVRFHKTGVTLKQLNDAQYERLSSESSPITTWVTGRQIYQVSRRREYGSQASSTMVNALRKARLWTDQAIDPGVERDLKQRVDELRDEMDELLNQVGSIKTQADDLTKRQAELQTERNEIVSEKNSKQEVAAAFRTLPSKITGEEIKLRGIEESLATSHDRRMDIISEQEKYSLERGQCAIDYAIAVNTLLKHHSDLYEAELWTIEAESELSMLKERNADINRLLNERKDEVQSLERELKAQKILCKDLVAKWQHAQAAMNPEDEQMLHELISTETTMDEYNAEIEATRGRIELLHAGNPQLIEQFERRQQDIDKLQEKLSNFDDQVTRLTATVTEIREKWEPELDKLVSEISDAFSHNFEQIGCAGQVGIHKDEDDFSQWAIRIEVKFRENEQLSLLDSHRQSGGERAVSTIFYLMALQSLARAPFRVVDEINQGMDPRNERMVHERMVDIACSENTSQYFLITPKLLPGLKYHERMVVHTIYSGETMPADNTLDLNRLADLALRVAGKVN